MELQKINKKWWFFAAAILAQFIVMFIWTVRSNDTIQEGTLYKFRLEGYDPHDLFRGEYLRIQFKEDKVQVSTEETFPKGEPAYVTFENDVEGFAHPIALSKKVSESSLKVCVMTGEFLPDSTRKLLRIYYPFNKFWMNQEDCPIAERIINRALNNNQDVYALVYIKDGEGALTDIEVDGVDIKTLVQEEWTSDNDREAEFEEPQDSIQIEEKNPDIE